jgi:uncharacterized membrane protein
MPRYRTGAATVAPKQPKEAEVVGTTLVRIADLLVQVVLIVLGFFIMNAEDEAQEVDLLLVWSAVGTLYWLAAVIAVAVSVRRSGRGLPSWLTRLELHPVVNLISTTATFATSIVGLVAAAVILVLRNDPGWTGSVEPVGVWAMLLSWALFHWGFARIYERRSRLASTPQLLFPRTPEPRLGDFVYFSFTNATTFSVSDVQVLTTRMRWTVVWHTSISFFLNALIIVLAFSTIINA